MRVAGLRRRAGRRRAGRRRRAGGSARGRRPRSCRARRTRRSRRSEASRWTASGESTSTASTTHSTWPRRRPVDLVAEAQDGDHERDVGLDRGDDVAGRGALLGDEREHAVARLGERREALERLEGRRQALAVALGARAADACDAAARPGGAVAAARAGGGRGHRRWVVWVVGGSPVIGSPSAGLSAAVDAWLSKSIAIQAVVQPRRCARASRRGRARATRLEDPGRDRRARDRRPGSAGRACSA